MSAQPSPARQTSTAAAPIPRHWTPEQALAVLEFLQALRHALWDAYGPELQQAWRDQIAPDGPPPEFDPDEPF
jgi:hypothetical protein